MWLQGQSCGGEAPRAVPGTSRCRFWVVPSKPLPCVASAVPAKQERVLLAEQTKQSWRVRCRRVHGTVKSRRCRAGLASGGRRCAWPGKRSVQLRGQCHVRVCQDSGDVVQRSARVGRSLYQLGRAVEKSSHAAVRCAKVPARPTCCRGDAVAGQNADVGRE